MNEGVEEIKYQSTTEGTTKERSSSTAILVLGAVTLILVMSAFIPARWLGIAPTQSAYTPVDFSSLEDTHTFTQDTNGDNKISWKELILSTEEGSSSVSELSNTPPDKKVIEALNDPTNLTAKFSKNLYITSTYLKNNNVTDADSQQKALNGILADVASNIVPKTYSYTDLTVAKKEDAVSIRMYGNALAKILTPMITKKNIEADLPGVALFIQTKDEKNLTAIILDAERVDEVVQKLRTLLVPPSAVIYHLMVLNQVALYADSLSNLSKAATDPIRAELLVQKYPDILVDTLRIYKTLSGYFSLKNIVYKAGEAGYVFTIGYTLQ